MKTLGETRLRIKAVRDITVTVTVGLFLFEITLTEIFIEGFRETLPNLEEA